MPNLRRLQFISKMGIRTNFHKNYNEATSNNELEEVKHWLNSTKPKYLCIFFTNNWNPVAIEANKSYQNFTAQPTPFTNLLVDTDKHPKLKWFFDSKCEPGFHFYFYGAEVLKFGGSNFDRATKEMKRIHETIDNSSQFQEINSLTTGYEMPYYAYEKKLTFYGNVKGTDPYQTFEPIPFAPQCFLKHLPFEEKWIADRLKK